MSDVDPDLPDYVVEAILSQGPPPDAVDLVKNAFTWRTIDAELMELAYDSVLDEAGVRDASARRTMEFTAGDISIVIEIEAGSIRGQLSPTEEAGELKLVGTDATIDVDLLPAGSFSVTNVTPGSYRLQVSHEDGVVATPIFSVG